MITRRMNSITIVLAVFALLAISQNAGANTTLDSIAESYVKLVLKVGKFDKPMVDSYFGPEEWRPSEPPDESLNPPYQEFLNEAKLLAERLRKVDSEELSGLRLKRYRYLEKEIIAFIGRIRMLLGSIMSFDEETRTLYDLELPSFNQAYYDSLLQELDRLLPGEGSVADRFNAYQAQLKVPKDS
jgi:hypothetical protein